MRSFPRLRSRGITVAMGTDTAPADMLMNLMLGLLTARIADEDVEAVHSKDLWDAATLGGAKALGRSDLGRLQAGAPADIAIFALDDALMTPAIDPITTLVNGGSGKVTKAVFVDGRLSMRDRQVAGLDLVAAQSRAQAQFDGLVQRYPDRTFGHPPVSQIFPPSYPIEGEAT